jgi:hypothetical protein
MYPGRSGLESPSMADDDGVLGNLPNSRPGRRSAKRDAGGRPAGSAGKAAAKAERAGKPAAKPARAPRAARTSPKAVRTSPKAGRKDPARPERLAPEPSGDPVTAAVRTAAGLAVTGARVAGAVTQELLRRLPRP